MIENDRGGLDPRILSLSLSLCGCIDSSGSNLEGDIYIYVYVNKDEGKMGGVFFSFFIKEGGRFENGGENDFRIICTVIRCPFGSCFERFASLRLSGPLIVSVIIEDDLHAA